MQANQYWRPKKILVCIMGVAGCSWVCQKCNSIMVLYLYLSEGFSFLLATTPGSKHLGRLQRTMIELPFWPLLKPKGLSRKRNVTMCRLTYSHAEIHYMCVHMPVFSPNKRLYTYIVHTALWIIFTCIAFSWPAV